MDWSKLYCSLFVASGSGYATYDNLKEKDYISRIKDEEERGRELKDELQKLSGERRVLENRASKKGEMEKRIREAKEGIESTKQSNEEQKKHLEKIRRGDLRALGLIEKHTEKTQRIREKTREVHQELQRIKSKNAR